MILTHPSSRERRGLFFSPAPSATRSESQHGSRAGSVLTVPGDQQAGLFGLRGVHLVR